ncbi:MAG TPA: hypothetical protein VE439_00545, partial [Anaerolineae bacterium]|nr:hypothetical protein [Anaerolineae bacterium]
MTRVYRSLSLPARLAIIFVVAAVFMVAAVLIALADGVGPTFSSFSPAPGSEATVYSSGWFTVSFAATDPDSINGSSVQVKLNGKSASSSNIRVSYREIGHWEFYYDWYWVVDGYDYTQATISADFSGVLSLPDRNTVWVSIADQQNNTSTTEWTFNYDKAPVISNLAPANGSTVTTLMPTISAKVTDNGTID